MRFAKTPLMIFVYSWSWTKQNSTASGHNRCCIVSQFGTILTEIAASAPHCFLKPWSETVVIFFSSIKDLMAVRRGTQSRTAASTFPIWHFLLFGRLQNQTRIASSVLAKHIYRSEFSWKRNKLGACCPSRQDPESLRKRIRNYTNHNLRASSRTSLTGFQQPGL